MGENNDTKIPYDILGIQGVVPHRYPFLLIDRIVEFEDNHRVLALKNVTINEPFFAGHFPGRPVMPGVLILEAMAQAGCILARESSNGSYREKLIYLVGADDVKWKRQVVPGDTLHIEMISVKKRRPLWIMDGKVTINGEPVASARISALESD